MFLGIDMSLNSPGFCVKKLNNEIICYAFSNGKKKLANYVSDNFKIYYFDSIKELTKFQKFDKIIEVLELIFKEHPLISSVAIEDYSYGSEGSSVSKIYELGGVIRYWFYKKGIVLQEFSPKTIKKSFCTNGNATKSDMYNEYLKKKFPVLFITKKINNKKQKIDKIPSPYSDIVDAIAVANHLSSLSIK